MRKVSNFKFIVFLTIISIVVIGLIACGGSDATNPSGFSQGGSTGDGGSNLPNFTERTNITFITNTGTVTNGNGGNTGGGGNTGVGDLGDNNGDTGNRWNIDQTKGLSFYGASRRTVYLRGASPTPWISVSYNDTDRLTRMWKYTIDGGIKDGQRRKYIKSFDGDFFFDADYNIRWSKQPDVILKRFQGGAIVQLKEGYGNNEFSSIEEQRGGVRFSGSWTIGGLYTYDMHLRDANKFNSDSVNAFFGSETGLVRKPDNSIHLYKGRMEILVLHPGYPVDKGTGKYKGLWAGSRPGQGWTGEAWAAQSYMQYLGTGGAYDDGRGNGLYNIKGNSPERYTPHLSTYQIYHLYFRWVVDEVYNPNNFPTDSAR